MLHPDLRDSPARVPHRVHQLNLEISDHPEADDHPGTHLSDRETDELAVRVLSDVHV